ncbi:uncharacterized protein K452DRAFT_230941 [Aplosporella prunicola CBS 121167]|uniref:Methyltransferase type 11 domain-containing protein n=1 Tax=Aplosporella prunicola CBS 121167 TaxID=1176127 RepID=A0A6A6B7Q0_9PEZI|nr:uncharacterized protein K452DRAFT_230941 [Aplosporella prunicola CBS 121167]KAF2140222.1 hypothetical protein K452DRAFT_230941 [Aplosporella prunicola CBS 121167]
MVKESLEELAHPQYWDKRYAEKQEEKFDWLRTFATVRPFLEKHLPAPTHEGPKLVQLGCGNSTLSKDMYDVGYTHQTNVDFSDVVIADMRAKHPEMQWLVMDVRDLKFPADHFDVAVDKATLDAMLYGSLWDPPDEVRANVKAYVDEVARVLKPGCKWLYITWRQPHFIKPLLQRPGVWTLEAETLANEPGGGGMFEYFGFVMTKEKASS